jgi:hypothetical protein
MVREVVWLVVFWFALQPASVSRKRGPKFFSKMTWAAEFLGLLLLKVMVMLANEQDN